MQPEGYTKLGSNRIINWIYLKKINNNIIIFNRHNLDQMEQGRQRNIETKMKGNLNLDNKLTDLYLPRNCDYTDRLITPKDNASIQLNICDLNEDGTINLGKSNIITICGFVRSVGESDTALDKVLR